MVDLNELLPDDILSELDAFDRLVESQRHQTLAQLLRAWYGHGERLAAGHRVHLDDFGGMLSARDAIGAVLGRASFPTQKILLALISYADSQFFSGTVPDDAKILGVPENQPGWWWHRIPENSDATGRT
jgi:hypothetical protein